jgi:superfamily II DNA/RNA helicase
MPHVCKDPYDSSDPALLTIFETYPYPLSDFQKYAIEGIHRGDHVLTCAPTGSGKTLAAEFAIQYFQKQGKKVIYTSPIKALSNQKYHEFSQKYPHISFGLLTGDIKTNPGADVLIMTTEILMNKLFQHNNQSHIGVGFDIDVHTELACVIFDEVHYINDADRGHVWEQTIVMLPSHVQMVMLSATIDDPVGFAKWCETCKRQNEEGKKVVYLAHTTRREVPLTHYVFWATTEDPFKKIKDKSVQEYIREKSHKFIQIRSPTGKFNDDAYHVIGKLHHLFNKERMYMKRNFVLNRLCEHLRDAEMLPAIAFVFSRKNVEICAKSITTNLLEFDSKVPYTMRDECDKILRKFPNYREYAELPEYNQLIGLLEKGVGIHHSGMIPVLRELVEIMISRKHVKLLFATESFAIGLDCPIRTAIFTDLTKYDNHGNRALYSHEYTQMAGRAGRRGIDTVGHVVHCNNLFELPPLPEYQAILSGKPQKLVSKYHISYSGILSFLQSSHFDGEKVDENGQDKGTPVGDIEQFMKRSMLASELDLRQTLQQKGMTKQAEKIQEMRTLLQNQNQNDQNKNPPENSLETISPEIISHTDIYKKYQNLKEMMNIDLLAPKKKKEIEKELAKLKQEYPSIDQQVQIYGECLECEKLYAKESETYEYTANYISTQIAHVCEIMQQKGLLEIVRNNSEPTMIKQTLLGKHAALSAEIPAIIMCSLLEKTDYFADYNAAKMIQLFSLFTQIKAAETGGNPSFPFQFIQGIAEEMIRLESQYQVETGIDYDGLLQYELVDEMKEWCACTTELECKQFIQGRLADKGITVGDFTKAILKISTITREVSAICELAGKVETMHMLSQIDGLILKYVTTAQSLYI